MKWSPNTKYHSDTDGGIQSTIIVSSVLGQLSIIILILNAFKLSYNIEKSIPMYNIGVILFPDLQRFSKTNVF